MKPGATIWFLASITRLAVASNFPTRTIRPSLTATEPRNQGLPVPSMMRPLTISRSYCSTGCAGTELIGISKSEAISKIASFVIGLLDLDVYRDLNFVLGVVLDLESIIAVPRQFDRKAVNTFGDGRVFKQAERNFVRIRG